MPSSRQNGLTAKTSRENGAASKDVAPFLRALADWKGYVNVELTDAEKSQFRAFINDASLVQEVTAETLLHGYKLSVVQVDDPETVKATAFAAFKGMPDSGLGITVWAGDLYEAVAGVIFLVAILSRYDLSKHVKPEEKRSRRTF